MTNDLYILLLIGILIIAGSYLLYLWNKKFEIAVFFFALTPLISAIFFDNLPEDPLVVIEATIGIGGMLRALTLFLLGGMGIIKYLSNVSKNKWRIPIHILLLGVFILFAAFSAFYSLDLKFTLIRSGLLFAVFSFLLGLNEWLREEGNLTKALNALFVLIIVLIIVNLLAMVVIPARVWWWKQNRLIGLWEQPNTFGAFCMLSYPVLIWKFYKTQNLKKYYIVIPLLLTLGMHILTGSRTTLLASSVGVFIWLLLERNWLKLFSVSIVVGFFLIILLNFSPSSFERNEGSQITDLSSREDIWSNAEIFIKEKPLFGYGFGVEGKIFQDELRVDLEGSFIERNVRQSLHNGYLSILVGSGFVGLIFWLLILLLPVWLTIKAPFSPEKAYATFTVVVVLITNFVESALTGYSLPSDIFFWLAWVVLGVIWFKMK